MKKFFSDFKKFISKGNVLDMAIGVIMGSSFSAIVNSLVKDILTPLISLFVGADTESLKVKIGKVTFDYGNFIMAVIHFFIVAITMFILIKIFMKIKETTEKAMGINTTVQATTKKCPYCMSEINIDATRCPNCTSVIEEKKEEAQTT